MIGVGLSVPDVATRLLSRGIVAPTVYVRTPPSITRQGSVLTATRGVWNGSPTVTGQWTRDGVAITAQTALTYTYNAATDDGAYLQYMETANTTVTAASNALISGASSDPYYYTTFAAPDGTSLAGYDGWSAIGTAKPEMMTINNNDLFQTADLPGNNAMFVHQTANSDFDFEVKANTAAANGTHGGPKYLVVRVTDSSNYAVVNFDWNNWSSEKRVGGAYATLKSYTSRSIPDGTLVRVRLQGDYLRILFDGVETNETLNANGGLGFYVGDVPAITRVGFLGQSLPPYPQAYVYDAALYGVLKGTITVSQSSVTAKQATLSGTVTGSVTALQASVLSSTGKVILPWASVTGLSGSSFTVTTQTLPGVVTGDTVTVWLRDSVNKSIAKGTSVLITS